MSEKARASEQPELTYIKGIGPRRAAVLQRHGINNINDLLYYFPRTYLDRSEIRKIGTLSVNEDVTVVGRVIKAAEQPTRKGRILKVTIRDESGFLTLIWFRGVKWLRSAFAVGDVLSVSGKVTFFRGLNMSHPDFDILADNKESLHTGRIIPVYPLTQALREAGFSSRLFRRVFAHIFSKNIFNLPELIPTWILDKYSLCGLYEAVRSIHLPEDQNALAKAEFRLKFQEFFFFQILLALRKKWIKKGFNRFRINSAGELIFDLVRNLPFELTDAQKKVVHEIFDDLKSDKTMNRLLQGDVGSGKTIVAALTASIMAANNYQTAIMAPTEILAEQHYQSFSRLFKPLGVNSQLLIGRQSKKQKEQIVQMLKDGDIRIIIGTHALLQEHVGFKDLGLIVIDEQHRFGVDQRGELIAKGLNPHVLAMTATPIPRTLSMSLYGDMDVSVIDALPEGRQKILSRTVTEDSLASVYEFIRQEVAAGRQCYIVYPLISESQKMDLQAAEEGYRELSENVFCDLKVALLHSRTKKQDKEEIIGAFQDGSINILVSTTVIEVGVNVPNATVMLIENAERFGLTQLHQLRGRVGRGSDKSYCIFVARQRSELGIRRLRILEKTGDGFKISEEDLKLRGPGDYFSTRQHGETVFTMANLVSDGAILHKARSAAFHLVHDDEQLLKPENRALKEFFLKHFREKLHYAGIS